VRTTGDAPRILIGLAAGLLALCACAGADRSPQSEGASPIPSHLDDLDVAALQERMEKGSLSSVELTRYYLDRIERLNEDGPALRAILEVNPDALTMAAALDEERQTKGARGPLHGIPVVLKGNIDTGDRMATTAGSLALAGHVADEDAFLVARLREAGAVILAKANLSEWANFRSNRSSSGWSSIGRQTRNPYSVDRNPCGSSSGSAVAVAANLTALAVGTETDGSIVCPSGANGIVGVKPTLGLVSRDGIIPIAHSQDTAGPMGRTVRDAAVLLAAMVAKDPDDAAAKEAFPEQVPDYLASLGAENLSGLRIGVMRDHWGAGENPDVAAHYERAIETLKGLGAEIVDPADLGDRDGLNDAEYEVLLYEFKTDLEAYLRAHGSPNGLSTLEDIIAFNAQNKDRTMPFFGQEIMEMAAKKGPLTEEAYKEALATSKKKATGAIDGAIAKDRLDAIIAPTNGPAWRSDLVNGDHFSMASSTLAAVSGYPNVTVPMGMVHGLPVGLSFFGAAHSEPVLLRIADAFERRTGARPKPGFLPTLALD